MEGSSRVKYRPDKTHLALAELRVLCNELQVENEKLKAELQKAQKDRTWALRKLQDEQIQNRQLGIIITQLVEGGKDAGHSRCPVDNPCGEERL